MNSLIASTDSAAELIGIAIMGFVVFAIVAVVKAFTRRTVGWIVAGSICGFFLSIPVIVLTVRLIIGLMPARQYATGQATAPAVDNSLRMPASPPLRPPSTIQTVQGGNPASPPLRPPSTSQAVQGGNLAYTITLPPEWTFKRNEEDFDVVAWHSSLYVAVIAEEAALGSPETIANIAREKIKNAATDLRWSEPVTLLLDGRSWLQFVVRCSYKGIPVAYQFYVYAGPEGTYQVVGWTAQNLYDRDSGLMRDVMRTFRFPTR